MDWANLPETLQNASNVTFPAYEAISNVFPEMWAKKSSKKQSEQKETNQKQRKKDNQKRNKTNFSNNNENILSLCFCVPLLASLMFCFVVFFLSFCAFFHSFCFFVFVCVCLSLSHSHPLCLSISLWLSLCLSFSLYIYFVALYFSSLSSFVQFFPFFLSVSLSLIVSHGLFSFQWLTLSARSRSLLFLYQIFLIFICFLFHCLLSFLAFLAACFCSCCSSSSCPSSSSDLFPSILINVFDCCWGYPAFLGECLEYSTTIIWNMFKRFHKKSSRAQSISN